MAKHGNDDRKTDYGLGGGHRHDKEHDDLPLHRTQVARERNEGQIHGVEHQLDGHQDHDQIPPHQDPDHADGENHRAENQVVLEGHHIRLRLSLGQNHSADDGHQQQHGSDLEG